MAKKDICVIGRFDPNAACDGQTIKTLELVRALCDRYGGDNIRKVSYHAVKGSKTGVFSLLFRAFAGSRKVVLAARGAALPNLVRACITINKIFHRPIYYVLIGGALAEVTSQRPELLPLLSQVEGIYVETGTLVSALEAQGVKCVRILPNFKHLRLYTADELPPEGEPPYRLVYMSRVAEAKGVAEMTDVIRRVNSDGVKYTLDIYGMVNPEYEAAFEAMKKDFPDYICYRGVADAWQTSEIMHGSFAQLFPTKCATEGQPASVIDSFFAGVPVIAARWNSCLDMIDEGRTGLTFPLGDFAEMEKLLRELALDPGRVYGMRENCLAQAREYLPEKAAAPLLQAIDSYDGR